MDLGNIRFQKFGNSAMGTLRAPGGIRGRGGMRMVLGPQIPAPVSPLAISTHTKDPSTANCRVFVGNLNTMHLTSEDVMEVFRKYGDVIGISVHKGYAFVQFTRTFEARNAAENEDGMIYAGQRIDCNVASEPKPSTAGKKRTAAVVAGHGATVKRCKIAEANGLSTNSRNLVEVSTSDMGTELAASSKSQAENISGYKDDADILICGKCRSLFTSIDTLLAHKQKQCKLQFVCQCEAINPGIPYAALQTYQELTCSTCQAKLPGPWALIKHLEHKHSLCVCVESPDKQATCTQEQAHAESQLTENEQQHNESDGTESDNQPQVLNNERQQSPEQIETSEQEEHRSAS